ncbi:hypothetical protein COV19_07080 [Candidatus Woesearchaeota archaeon CG10_big_fil_rev_8_21_14_0_10_44_13]|nr:MAG: hypothetical protein COV19_07080 [Candidatus Woesearchaeota archaeon CG10_big_fil_rev_8_21_14_0_10_44_13]
MKKLVKVIFSPEAELVYNLLNTKTTKLDRMLLDAINQKIRLVKIDIHYGDPISKPLTPVEYKLNYNINNLFRIELPDFWRMLYTLTSGKDENELIVFILDIIDHKTYDKKFSYKKK